MQKGASWVSWIQILAGLWLILAPFILGYSGTPRGNDIVLGLIVGILAIIALASPGQ